VLAKTYAVATGTPQYPTPKGNFQIVLKRFRPTWVNPDPSGWGKSLPKSIPPGPSNPLGTRAMNLNSPGIRIHGTTNIRSLGTAASHGCIRMAMPDVEELFEKVDSGTPVIIITGPPKAAPAPAAPISSIGDPNAPVDLEAG
jgi:L,D-transpeptidase ErfK/SrfK